MGPRHQDGWSGRGCRQVGVRGDFREQMVRLFRSEVPLEVIDMFKEEYCGLCCIKFSGPKFCWKHYTGRGHAGLLQRRTYRNRPLPWQMVFHALIQEPEGASQQQIVSFIQGRFPSQLEGREVAALVEATLGDMVNRFRNVVFDQASHQYRLRDRRPTDLPNPIPAGCDREEKRRSREVRLACRELGGRREEVEGRLEPEEVWRERVAREGGRRKSQRVEREVAWGEGMGRRESHREGKENLWEEGISYREERGRRCSQRGRVERSPEERGKERSRSSARRHGQDRDDKSLIRTPDATPPRPAGLACRPRLLPRHLAFGPVGSRRPGDSTAWEGSKVYSAAYHPLLPNTSAAFHPNLNNSSTFHPLLTSTLPGGLGVAPVPAQGLASPRALASVLRPGSPSAAPWAFL